jgi:hypothetical protein
MCHRNALVFGGAREHRVFPGRSGNLVQHRPNPPNWGTVNEVHGEYFEALPARSTVKVAELLMGTRGFTALSDINGCLA